MARRINRKCQQCASLTVEEAIALHGSTGDNCWNPSNENGWGYDCHRRRSHYRHREDNNRTRRRLRRAEQQATRMAALIEPSPVEPLLDAASTALSPIETLPAESWASEQPSDVPASTVSSEQASPSRAPLQTVVLGTAEFVSLELPPPNLPYAAVLVLYRQHKDSPVHAIAAEIWQGKHKILNIQPIHCMGMRGNEVTTYIQTLLTQLQEQFNVSRFEDVIKELPVHHCPLVPCPFKSDSSQSKSQPSECKVS